MSTIENFIKAANITTPNALYKWMNKNIKYGYTSRFRVETKRDVELSICKFQKIDTGASASAFMHKHMNSPKLITVDIDKR